MDEDSFCSVNWTGEACCQNRGHLKGTLMQGIDAPGSRQDQRFEELTLSAWHLRIELRKINTGSASVRCFAYPGAPGFVKWICE